MAWSLSPRLKRTMKNHHSKLTRKQSVTTSIFWDSTTGHWSSSSWQWIIHFGGWRTVPENTPQRTGETLPEFGDERIAMAVDFQKTHEERRFGLTPLTDACGDEPEPEAKPCVVYLQKTVVPSPQSRPEPNSSSKPTCS